jgi:hypothetical protein
MEQTTQTHVDSLLPGTGFVPYSLLRQEALARSGCRSALGLKWTSRLRGFDVVCTMEVIEHAADPKRFVAASLVKPGGLLLVSTLNRT